MPPLAYFLTWTTYATWLHGDERGSVDTEHNIPKTPFLPPNPRRRDDRAQYLTAEPFTLNRHARTIVCETIERHCTIRGWRLLQLNVRTNHVHAVVAAPVKPEVVLAQLKAWCTRKLREAELVGPSDKVWTEHGSTRYLWDEEAVLRARRYTRNRQGPDI